MSWNCQVCAPVVAVRGGTCSAPAFEPYVIVTVDPAVSVMAEMVTPRLRRPQVPALDVV